MSNENLDFLVYQLQHDQSSDRTQIARLTQLIAYWLVHHPGEPLNLERAAFEFEQRRKEYAIQHIKDDAERQKRTQAEQNDLSEACRKLAEPRFEVFFNDDKDGRAVIWDDVIKDPVTHEKLGSVRDLIRINWVRPQLDPRDNSQIGAYLAEIRKLFDNCKTSISNSRHFEPRMIIEKAPFKKAPDRVYKAMLTMRWKELP